MARDPQLWRISLARLRDKGDIGRVGVRCDMCHHHVDWPIDEVIERYGERTLVSDLAPRWRCSKCGRKACHPYTIARMGRAR